MDTYQLRGKSLNYFSETFVHDPDLFKYFYYEHNESKEDLKIKYVDHRKFKKSTNVSESIIKKLSVVKPISG